MGSLAQRYETRRMVTQIASFQSSDFTVVLGGSCAKRWAGLERALAAYPKVAAVRSAAQPAEFSSLIQRCSPCVVIANAEHLVAACGSTNGVGPLRLGLGVRMLAAEEAPGAEALERALRMGWWGIVAPSAPVRLVRRAVLAVSRGELWVSRAVLTQLVLRFITAINCGLTHREAEILGLVAAGYKNQEIAGRLFITLETVRWHLRSLYSKLGVHDRLSAAMAACGLPGPVALGAADAGSDGIALTAGVVSSGGQH